MFDTFNHVIGYGILVLFGLFLVYLAARLAGIGWFTSRRNIEKKGP